MNNIDELKQAALEGVSDDMLLGGWTAKKLSDYAKFLEEQNTDLATQLEAAQKHNAELERDGILPGVMQCAKCSFTLDRVSLNFGNGTVTAGGNEIEPCPNGCGPLHPDTWKRSREELCARFNAAEAELSAANEKLRKPVEFPDCDIYSVSHIAHWYSKKQCEAWVSGVEFSKKQIKAAGFTVEGE
ncbi:hypothetical protein BF17_16475 [Yersinia similis]|uniref:Ead/Ea22-like family protein n=1 Tax=Yersinia similis TaxID=367190 RepID=A0ABN4CU50_9GAMM|nr:hypothetical protein [Yersinia similis]AHK21988.1 hypothetical protein BF17_16475 [Yersinia similis]CFQ60410.1 Uncharacterised protein [Yersinia similis]